MTPGTRVRFKRRVDRFPDFIVPEGTTGMVTRDEHGIFGVTLDEPLKGSEEWDGEVHWYAEVEDDPRADLEELP